MNPDAGQIITNAREAKGWTQADLAKAVSRLSGEAVSRGAVAQWETGQTKNIRPLYLFGCADALELDARVLAGYLTATVSAKSVTDDESANKQNPPIEKIRAALDGVCAAFGVTLDDVLREMRPSTPTGKSASDYEAVRPRPKKNPLKAGKL